MGLSTREILLIGVAWIISGVVFSYFLHRPSESQQLERPSIEFETKNFVCVEKGANLSCVPKKQIGI